MNAPDKIYQCRFADGEYDVTYCLTPDEYAENTEYIRKDALLEWAREVANDTNHSLVYRGAFRDLIDKINSL